MCLCFVDVLVPVAAFIEISNVVPDYYGTKPLIWAASHMLNTRSTPLASPLDRSLQFCLDVIPFLFCSAAAAAWGAVNLVIVRGFPTW